MATLTARKKESTISKTFRLPVSYVALLVQLGDGNATEGLNEILVKNKRNMIKAIQQKEDDNREKESLKKRKKAS